MKTIAIIVAGGKGKRLGRPKQFLKIAGRPMLAWTLAAFQRAGSIDGVILVVAKEQLRQAKGLRFSKIIKVVAGGQERQDSVKNGLKALPDSAQIVAIHDGARPLITFQLIDQAVKEAKRFGAVVVGVPVKDTIKQIKNEKCKIKKTLDRRQLWAAQTPQVFRTAIIKKAYVQLTGRVTDDAMAVEKIGKPVKIIRGSYDNLKVTTADDLLLAGKLLKKKVAR